MEFEELTPELKEKARACETAEDMPESAKQEGYELSDGDLDAVAGGLAPDMFQRP